MPAVWAKLAVWGAAKAIKLVVAAKIMIFLNILISLWLSWVTVRPPLQGGLQGEGKRFTGFCKNLIKLKASEVRILDLPPNWPREGLPGLKPFALAYVPEEVVDGLEHAASHPGRSLKVFTVAPMMDRNDNTMKSIGLEPPCVQRVQ